MTTKKEKEDKERLNNLLLFKMPLTDKELSEMPLTPLLIVLIVLTIVVFLFP